MHPTSLCGRTFEVALGRESITVHEDLICTSPKHFETALSGDWKEAKEYSFKLEDEGPKNFQLYLH